MIKMSTKRMLEALYVDYKIMTTTDKSSPIYSDDMNLANYDKLLMHKVRNHDQLTENQYNYILTIPLLLQDVKIKTGEL